MAHFSIYTNNSTVEVGSMVGSSQRCERKAHRDDFEGTKVSKTNDDSRHQAIGYAVM